MKNYEIRTSAKNAESWAVNKYDSDGVKGAFFRPGIGVYWDKEHDAFLKTVSSKWMDIPDCLLDDITAKNFYKEIRLVEEKEEA